MFSNAIYEQMVSSIKCLANREDVVEPEHLEPLFDSYRQVHLDEHEWGSISAVLNKWLETDTYVPVFKVMQLLGCYVTNSDDDQADLKFEMHEEDYENGIQYISIFSNTGSRFEIRVWNDILDHEAFLKAKAAKVDDDQLYKMVLHYTTLEKTAESWKEIRKRD